MSEIMSDQDKISYWEQKHKEVLQDLAEARADCIRLQQEINCLRMEPCQLPKCVEARAEIEQLKWANKVNSDEWKQLTDHLKTKLDRLEKALNQMGCSELLDCETPIIAGSKHGKRCHYRMAQEALAHKKKRIKRLRNNWGNSRIGMVDR